MLVDELNRRKFDIRYLDIGGGLGITYADEKPPVPADIAAKLLPPIINGRKTHAGHGARQVYCRKCRDPGDKGAVSEKGRGEGICDR